MSSNNSAASSKARLRTRSGCLTSDLDSCGSPEPGSGRKRRVKCGEEKPTCRNCTAAARDCIWPGPESDLVDGRQRQNRTLQRRGNSGEDKDAELAGNLSSSLSTLTLKAGSPPCKALGDKITTTTTTNTISPAARLGVSEEIEQEILRHHSGAFFFEILTIPTANRADLADFHDGVVRMMGESPSVRSAVLAASAASISALSKDRSYQKIALRYYADAVMHCADGLRALEKLRTGPSDVVLTTVIWLYVHDLWSLDPELDARKHVAGAVNLVRWGRLCANTGTAPQWNRVTIESVLYQALYLAIRRPLDPDFHVDPQFLSECQDGSTTTDDSWLANVAHGVQSPVLGLPLELYGLVVSVVELRSSQKGSARGVGGMDDEDDDVHHKNGAKTKGKRHQDRSRTKHSPQRITQIRKQVEQWEMIAHITESRFYPQSTVSTPEQSAPSSSPPPTSSQPQPQPQPGDFGGQALFFYVLGTSLLLDLFSLDDPTPTPPTTLSSSWQVQAALDALRDLERCRSLIGSYLGTWPLLVIGLFVTVREDVATVRSRLKQLIDRTGFGEAQRMLAELEGAWACLKY
ncbi:hypothetical protein PspLS_09253 [Pyricularia sp. CBS 133598]|nr:hypothetical protein PspLS_09253 [Pyricularia sp. CBS 133598]